MGKSMFSHNTDEFSLVIRDRHVPDLVGLHQFGYISEGNVLGNADSRNFDIGNPWFHALDECRWLHTERLKRKTGLSIHLPATGGNVPAGLGMIFKCRVRDHARDGVCIRLPMTDN